MTERFVALVAAVILACVVCTASGANCTNFDYTYEYSTAYTDCHILVEDGESLNSTEIQRGIECWEWLIVCIDGVVTTEHMYETPTVRVTDNAGYIEFADFDGYGVIDMSMSSGVSLMHADGPDIDVAVYGLTIRDATSSDGPLFHVQGVNRSLTVGWTDFENNNVGNALLSAAAGSEFYIWYSSLDYNTVGDGSLILCNRSPYCNPYYSYFSWNVVTGGYERNMIIANNLTYLEVEGCVFEGNGAAEHGAVVDATNSSVVVWNALFEKNEGAAFAGVVCRDSTDCAIESSAFYMSKCSGTVLFACDVALINSLSSVYTSVFQSTSGDGTGSDPPGNPFTASSSVGVYDGECELWQNIFMCINTVSAALSVEGVAVVDFEETIGCDVSATAVSCGISAMLLWDGSSGADCDDILFGDECIEVSGSGLDGELVYAQVQLASVYDAPACSQLQWCSFDLCPVQSVCDPQGLGADCDCPDGTYYDSDSPFYCVLEYYNELNVTCSNVPAGCDFYFTGNISLSYLQKVITCSSCNTTNVYLSGDVRILPYHMVSLFLTDATSVVTLTFMCVDDCSIDLSLMQYPLFEISAGVNVYIMGTDGADKFKLFGGHAERGGLAYVDHTDAFVYIEDTWIEGFTGSYGSVVYARSGRLESHHSRYTENTANIEGGVFVCNGTCEFLVQNTLFSANAVFGDRHVGHVASISGDDLAKGAFAKCEFKHNGFLYGEETGSALFTVYGQADFVGDRNYYYKNVGVYVAVLQCGDYSYCKDTGSYYRDSECTHERSTCDISATFSSVVTKGLLFTGTEGSTDPYSSSPWGGRAPPNWNSYLEANENQTTVVVGLYASTLTATDTVVTCLGEGLHAFLGMRGSSQLTRIGVSEGCDGDYGVLPHYCSGMANVVNGTACQNQGSPWINCDDISDSKLVPTDPDYFYESLGRYGFEYCGVDWCAVVGDFMCPYPNTCATNTSIASAASIFCVCATGFGFDSNTGQCHDIDECAAGLDNCQTQYGCHNTYGSFSCCPEYEVYNATLGTCNCTANGTAVYDNGDCLPECGPGTFFKADSGCEVCGLNSYNPSWNQELCLPCPDGTNTGEVQSATNVTDCLCLHPKAYDGTGQCLCKEGFYEELEYQSCEPCPIGEYSDTKGASNCDVCPLGTTTVNISSVSINDCSECQDGWQYVSSECQVVCSPGQFRAEDQSICIKCPPNFYSDSGLASSCTQCPTGSETRGDSYHNHSTIASCLCLPGFEPTTDPTLAADTPCERSCGKGTSRASLTAECVLCPPGYYSDVVNSAECFPCPDNTDSTEGATKVSDCACRRGFYRNTNPRDGDDCLPCPDGALCDGDTSPPIAQDGYAPGSEPGSFVECTPSDACTDGDCAVGYTNLDRACSECASGFYRLSGRCYECTSNGGVIIASVLVAMLVMCSLLVWFNLSERTVNRFASVVIGLNSLQISAMYARLDIDWPAVASSLFNAISIANFNIELVRPECAVTTGDPFMLKWIGVLTLPFLLALNFCVVLGLGSLGIVIAEGAGRRVHVTAKFLRHTCVRAFYQIMTIVYLPLSAAVFDVFACREQADGSYALASSPSTPCRVQSWYYLLPVGVLFTLLYAIGVPAATGLLIYYKQKSLGAVKFQIRYGFLVGRYQEHFAYYELVVMARKLAVVVCMSILSDDGYVQAGLAAIVLNIALALQLYFKPFRTALYNIVEGVCVLSSIVVLLFGIMYADESVFQDAMIVLVVCINIIAIIVALVYDSMRLVREERELGKAAPVLATLTGVAEFQSGLGSGTTEIGLTVGQSVGGGGDEGGDFVPMVSVCDVALGQLGHDTEYDSTASAGGVRGGGRGVAVAKDGSGSGSDGRGRDSGSSSSSSSGGDSAEFNGPIKPGGRSELDNLATVRGGGGGGVGGGRGSVGDAGVLATTINGGGGRGGGGGVGVGVSDDQANLATINAPGSGGYGYSDAGGHAGYVGGSGVGPGATDQASLQTTNSAFMLDDGGEATMLPVGSELVEYDGEGEGESEVGGGGGGGGGALDSMSAFETRR